MTRQEGKQKSGENDQSGTRPEGKTGRDSSNLYKAGNRQEKRGKDRPISKKSWYISNKAGRKQGRMKPACKNMIIHQAIKK
jgi:hypothetical protein